MVKRNESNVINLALNSKQPLSQDDRSYKGGDVSDIRINTETYTFFNGLKATRPTNVRGVVVPTSTKGRNQAPLPIAISSILSSSNAKQAWKENYLHYDRGHIFGLQLGGPDESENIIPQWSYFQRNDEWRELEKHVVETSTSLLKK